MLANEANITRKTFYSHFQNVEDVRIKILNDYEERLTKVLYDKNNNFSATNVLPLLEALKNVIANYPYDLTNINKERLIINVKNKYINYFLRSARQLSFTNLKGYHFFLLIILDGIAANSKLLQNDEYIEQINNLYDLNVKNYI
jgi:AcrR family transcriptional regulator